MRASLARPSTWISVLDTESREQLLEGGAKERVVAVPRDEMIVGRESKGGQNLGFPTAGHERFHLGERARVIRPHLLVELADRARIAEVGPPRRAACR